MDAILFCDRQGEEFSPLNQWFNPALLPLLGKSLVQHNIESLQRAGAKTIHIVANTHIDRLKEELKNGAQWGVKLNFLYSKPRQDYFSLLKQQGDAISYPCLCSRGDIVFKNWLDCKTKVSANFNVGLATLLLVEPMMVVNRLKWVHLKRACETERTVDFYQLNSLQEYHTLVLSTVSNRKRAVIHSGKNIAPGATIGSMTSVSSKSLHRSSVYINHRSHVSPYAHLSEAVYIGKNCVIDRGARLKNSIVLDDTFVGSSVNLENAVIANNCMYRVDLNQHIFIDDESVLSSTQITPTTPLWQRAVALLTLVLLFPLLCLLLTLQCFTRTPLFRRIDLTINQSLEQSALTPSALSEGFVLQVNNTWIARIPLLLKVLTGTLRLTGRSPFHFCQPSAWSKQYQKIPVGLLSRAQITINPAHSAEAYEFCEIDHYFTPNRCKTKQFKADRDPGDHHSPSITLANNLLSSANNAE